jgi:hypothetical protein
MTLSARIVTSLVFIVQDPIQANAKAAFPQLIYTTDIASQCAQTPHLDKQ